MEAEPRDRKVLNDGRAADISCAAESLLTGSMNELTNSKFCERVIAPKDSASAASRMAAQQQHRSLVDVTLRGRTDGSRAERTSRISAHRGLTRAPGSGAYAAREARDRRATGLPSR
jgi:hypothetical protein